MIDYSDIEEHMEVVGSDGVHVGTVDHLALKLTKKDPSAHGQHHVIDVEMIDSIEDDKVILSVTAAEAMGEEDAIEEDDDSEDNED